jgi:uncharacterized protein YndB with AHSA1/START domain
MTATTATPESVVLEYDLAEPPHEVWRALTEPQLLATWLGPNDIRPEVGAQFQIDGDRGSAPVHCRILDAEPHRRLRWQQWERDDADARGTLVESLVSFELSALPDGGTHLRLVHDGFAVCPIVAMAGVAATSAATAVPLRTRRVRARMAAPTIVCSLSVLRRAA